MTSLDLSDLAQHLSVVVSDPALLGSFRLQNPTFVEVCRIIANSDEDDDTPSPFPSISEMTAIQAAIFDNWPEGTRTKSHPNRYGMAIEVWTKPGHLIKVTRKRDYQHKGNVRLMDAAELKKRIQGLQSQKLKNPISGAYAGQLLALQAEMQPGEYVGLIATKTPQDGTFYHDQQLVHVTIDGLDTRAVLIVGGGAKVLPRFSDKDPKGDPLKGNVALQSRWDGAGFSVTWATEDWE